MEVEPVDVPVDLAVEDPPSWILVEDEGDPPNSYNVIQDQEVIGDIDLAQHKIRYIVDGFERSGFIHLISTDRNFVEDERIYMFMECTSPEFPQYWALVNQSQQPDMIRIVMVKCRKVLPEPGNPNKGGYLLSIKQTASIKVLHILKSEQELRDELKNLQDHVMKVTMNIEKDNQVEAVGLANAYFLVQYFEDALTLTFAIVRYEDTMWKEDNQFPAVVAYIGTTELAHQCTILRKSFDVNELTQTLTLIRRMCNSLRHRDPKTTAGNVMREG